MDAAQQKSDPGQQDSTEVRVGRRKFPASYKRRILEEAAACKRGELGLMLRREGLYSSMLTDWRSQLRAGGHQALAPKKRGPRPDPTMSENGRLQRELAQAKEKLRQAELIIEVQKKLCLMLGLPTAEEVP